MHLQPRQCVQCPGEFPRCIPACGPGEECQILNGSCNHCATAVCKLVTNTGGNQGPNVGAIAGGVLGGLFAIMLIAGFLFYRHHQAKLLIAEAARKRATREYKAKPDIVASADAVLSRPDPNEKPGSVTEYKPSIQVYYAENTINLGPDAHPENPFTDEASIATASDKATNVIPIAYVRPRASIVPSATDRTPASVSGLTVLTNVSSPIVARENNTPTRPARNGPELDMRMHLSRPDSESSSVLLPPKAPYAPSARSDATALSGVSSRMSTISTTSSFLNESPQIVTPLKGNFRQVLGVQKAEVVQLGSPTTPISPNANRAITRSPLAQSAYTAEETVQDVRNNPFSDQFRPSTAGSSKSAKSQRAGERPDSRPTSIMSHAGTIVADISSAKRVQLSPPTATFKVGTVSSFSSASSSPRMVDFRTSDQLTPPAQAVPRSFDDAIDLRISRSSLASSNRTSTTDSILEAFPFVPPSPISMHHAQNSQPPTPSTPRSFRDQQELDSVTRGEGSDTETLVPPKPRFMSVMSTISSTSSNGLAAYPFEIQQLAPPSPSASHVNLDDDDHGSSRSSYASLDTLALSRDLEAFPLPFEGHGGADTRAKSE